MLFAQKYGKYDKVKMPNTMHGALFRSLFPVWIFDVVSIIDKFRYGEYNEYL